MKLERIKTFVCASMSLTRSINLDDIRYAVEKGFQEGMLETKAEVLRRIKDLKEEYPEDSGYYLDKLKTKVETEV